MTFGEIIASERKKQELSQRDLAARVLREDGKPISPQYLNDIERNRRNPPSEEIIKELAQALSLDPEYLFFVAGQMPPDLRDGSKSPESVQKAFVAFRRALKTTQS